MRKQLALLLAMILAAATLAGCGGTSGAGGQSGTTISGGGSTITYWHIGTEDPDKSVLGYGAEQYNANDSAESGYTIEQVATKNDQYKEKLAVAMSAGQCPDVYMHWSGGPMVEYVKSGYAQDITDLVDQYGLRDLYTEGSIAQATVDGKIYALPVAANSVAMFFYDKSLWAEKGYEVPETLDDLEALCAQMAADGITPFALANSAPWTGSMYYMYLVARYGGSDIVSDAFSGEGSLVNDATIFAGEKIEDWVSKGYFPEGVNSLSADNGDDRSLLYQGSAGMMLHGSWMVGLIKGENPDFYENLGTFSFPIIPDSGADQTAVVGTLGSSFISFNCTGEKLEEAFKMAVYFSTDEFMEVDAANGYIPPLKAATSEEPANQEILEVLNRASSVQLWWDQYLPAAVADAHKTASQRLFDISATPEAVAQEQQDAMDEYLQQNS